MKLKELKKLCWTSLIVLFALISFNCASIQAPDVPVCKELDPQTGYCAWTISKKSMIVDDTNKWEDKTWWQHRPYNIVLFPSTYEKFKATMTKICTQFQQNCQAADVNGLIARMDEVANYSKDKPVIVTPPPVILKPYPAQGWDVRYDDLIKSELQGKEILFTASNRMNFCPKWVDLSQDQKAVEFINYLHAITVFESGIKLASRMVETTMGLDPITGLQVASEGLFQLSYQDSKNYQGCDGIDFKKDKGLAVTDLKRTIFLPEVQIKCTVYIMDRILKNRSTENSIGDGAIGLGRYWSVVRTNKKANDIQKKMVEYKSKCF